MRLEQLRLFLLIAQHGSISAAARAASIAQPALSIHMRQLEESVDTILFERSVRGVKLTDAGIKLRRHADAILRHVEQAREEVIQIGSEPAGQVVVALSKSMVPPLAGKLFWRCHDRFPKINLRLLDLSVRDSRQLIETREVDFGLLPNAPTLEDVNIFPLIAQDLYLIGPRQADRNHPNFVMFKDLHRYPLVMGGKNDQLRIELQTTAIKHGFAINIQYEQDAAAIYHEIVRCGEIYTVVPYSIFAHDIEAGVLSAHKIIDPTPERIMSIVFRNDIELSNAALAVKSLIVELVHEAVSTGELSGRLLQFPEF